MDHKLRLYHVGPIQECDLDLNDFTVLTGPQSSGKSTVAKAVYFFRTVKQDILNIIMQGGPQAVSDRDDASWSMVLEQRLKNKFLQLFGTSWVMPLDMKMEYTYKKNVSIRVSLTENYDDPLKNYIEIEFSGSVKASQSWAGGIFPISLPARGTMPRNSSASCLMIRMKPSLFRPGAI